MMTKLMMMPVMTMIIMAPMKTMAWFHYSPATCRYIIPFNVTKSPWVFKARTRTV